MMSKFVKIGMRLSFDPNSTVEFEAFFQKKIGQAYCTLGLQSWFDPKFDVGIRTFFPKKFGQAYCTSDSNKPHCLLIWLTHITNKPSALNKATGCYILQSRVDRHTAWSL